MIVIGLTGSLGMGKTTTAHMLRELGVPVHDSDAAVHRLTAPGGAAVEKVAKAFPGSLDADAKSIDRRKLRALLGRDAEKWKKLEHILHPLVRKSQDDFLRHCRGRGKGIVALDIPLLFETGAERRVDYTICVTAPAFIQRRRALSRPGMTEDDLAFRLSRQMPDAEKRRRADFVVQTGNGRAHTRRALQTILKGLGG